MLYGILVILSGYIGITIKGNEAFCHYPLDEQFSLLRKSSDWDESWDTLDQFAKKISPQGSGFVFDDVESDMIRNMFLFVLDRLRENSRLSHVVFYGKEFLSAVPGTYYKGAARITVTEGTSGDTPLEIIRIPLSAYKFDKVKKKTDE